MQADGHGIVGIDARDHDVFAQGSGPRQKFDHQRSADALAAAVGTNMDAMLDAVAIARRRAKFAEGAEPYDARGVPGNHEWEAVLDLGVKPSDAALLSEFHIRVHGGGVANDFIVNRQNFGEILTSGIIDHVHINRAAPPRDSYTRPMHENDHDHDPAHEQSAPGDLELRVRALETVLAEKGFVDPEALDALVDAYQTKIGPHNGARVVARAWCDPHFRGWLQRDATAAIASLGFSGRQGEHMVAVENSADVHNLVVCTLCSCYPWPVLGLPPTWYKSAPYRARAVKDPRGVLCEFGLELPASTQIRIWDSTAEVRYLVVPRRPAGTENMSENELAALVTRDSMIGTGSPRAPA